MSTLISSGQARSLVLDYMRQKADSMARSFREVKAYLGVWRGKPVSLNMNEQIAEISRGTEIGNWLVQVTLNEVGAQTGQNYIIQ